MEKKGGCLNSGMRTIPLELVTSKWLIGGQNKNFNGRKNDGTIIIDGQISHLRGDNNYGNSNHRSGPNNSRINYMV